MPSHRRSRWVEVAREFAGRVGARMELAEAYLFGSRARGDARPTESDWDLLLVSPAFGRVRWIRRGLGLYRDWDYDSPGDGPEFHCLTPDEFARAKTMATYIQDAMRHAVKIWPPEDGKRGKAPRKGRR